MKKSLLILREIPKTMRVSMLFLLFSVGIMHAENSYSQTTKITLSIDNEKVADILEAVEMQSDFTFVYDSKIIDTERKTSVNVEDEIIFELLEQLFVETDIAYTVVNNKIVLNNKESVITNQQNNKLKITGTVTDPQGQSLPGAVIIAKNESNNVATTDMDGRYMITINEGTELEFSYIGYETQVINPNGRATLDIVLMEDLESLEELVVIGYGVQKKVNLTGSVSTINSKEIEGRVQTNVLSAIQGTVPGVTVISRPGQTPTINVRGRGNLGDSNPLYVIDGAISTSDIFQNLDPNIIETISFLKDAASSSIYGSRAAYGVVLVTTRQGKEGKVSVTYSGMAGVKMPLYMNEYVDSWDYAMLYNEAQSNAGNAPKYTDEEIGWFKDGSKPDLYPNTNWSDLTIRESAPITQHSLNFSGGSKALRYNAGLGYVYEEQFLKNRDNQRFNLNLNLASDVTDWLTFRTGVKYIKTDNDREGGSPSFASMLMVPSTFVAQHSNGNWGSVDGGSQSSTEHVNNNPLRAYDNRDWAQYDRAYATYDLGIDIKPVKGLIITGQGTYRTTETKDKYYSGTRDEVPSFINSGQMVGGSGNTQNKMTMDWKNYENILLTATATYNWSNEVHDITVLAGVSGEQNSYQRLLAQRDGFPADTFTDINAGATSGANYKNEGGSSEYKMLSYFGRVNYAILGKYLLEANIRADASSRFHKDNRWGIFPSVSAGWRISEENFMKGFQNIDELKVRASYGMLGNINNVGNYDYFQNYTSTDQYNSAIVYPWGDDIGPTIGESRPANITLGWEKVSIMDVGLDFSFYRGKLSGSVGYYLKNTTDILQEYPVSTETGISSDAYPSQNIASVKNNGVEIALRHANTIGDFYYSVGGTFSWNDNEIVALSEDNSDIILENGIQIQRYGSPIGSFYGLESDGLYTQAEIDRGEYYTYGGTTPNAGDIKYVPQTEKHFGEALTEDDRTIIGCDVPDITYGLNINLGWKGIDLSVFGQGVTGSDVSFDLYQMHPFFHGQDNPRTFHLENRWNPNNPNPNAIYPAIYPAGNEHFKYNQVYSDYNLFNADYFRIKNITLGYNFPERLLSNAKISALKIYLSAENPFTIRGGKFMADSDPEAASGIIGTYNSRSVAFGINISF